MPIHFTVNTLLLILFFCFSLIGLGAQAQNQDGFQNTVVFINQAQGSPVSYPGEIESRQIFSLILEKNLRQANGLTEFKFVYLALPNLNQLPEALKETLSKNDRVSAVIFTGHGSRQTLTFHQNALYNGAALAQLTYDALKDRPSLSELTVYFNACSCGREMEGKTNLQIDFLKKFRRLDQTQKWATVNAIAHADFATMTEEMIFQPYNGFRKWFYSSRWQKMLYAVDMKIFNYAGLKILAQRSYTKAFTGGVAVALTTWALSHPMTHDLVASLASGAFSSAIFYAVAEITDSMRTAFVRTRSLRNGEISESKSNTIGDALRAAISSSSEASLMCRHIYL